jgi:hypothetical protein
MATSGTTTFNLDLTELIEEAFERCGTVARAGYDFRTARRSLGLLLVDFANRGINMWTIDSGSVAIVAGTATYALPADTVDLIEHVIRTGSGSTQTDVSLSRISVSTYATIPNKTVTGPPIQLVVNRTATPSVTLYPVPDTAETYTLVYWRLRRLEDAGNGVNTQDIPFRFLPAMAAGLAYYLAMKIPEAFDRLVALKAEFDNCMQSAMDEDREKATLRLVPRVGRM